MPSPTSRTCNDRYKRKVDICLTFCGSAINDGCKKIGHTHTHTKKEQKIELKAAAKRKLDVSPLPRSFSYYYVENGRRKKKTKKHSTNKRAAEAIAGETQNDDAHYAHIPQSQRGFIIQHRLDEGLDIFSFFLFLWGIVLSCCLSVLFLFTTNP